ncbi:MAG: hypothetical protein BGN92_07375 [Sphingobacteriales bacterium 41-5]|nr:MAG: hypothetical protein ABS67_03580 [Niabella sp. SCN 42-15]OJU26678.1 MAG: hypothetical protein BGN92_07375 [Sphingobacteriales bacterium 41-5]
MISDELISTEMNINRTEILNRICYTEVVYHRINKKLESNYSRSEIENLIFNIINETQEMFFQRIGKNNYVTNTERNIKIIINTNTYRIITVDRMTKQLFVRSYELGTIKTSSLIIHNSSLIT